MNYIKIADTTLSDAKSTLTFKQKLEIARKLERLGVDTVELPEVGTAKADSLLVRTAASFVKNSVLSVAATSSVEAIKHAAEALATAAHPRIRVELPMTSSIMEYTLHKKQNNQSRGGLFDSGYRYSRRSRRFVRHLVRRRSHPFAR